MDKIPVYLKQDVDQERPTDSEFYLVAQDNVYLCRNHPFFQSDVPIRRPVRSLARHEAACSIRYPRLGVAALEFVVGFFGKVFEQHGSEAIVLLLWNMERQRYKLLVPEQEATVWESYSGSRSPLDVRYTVPPLPRRHLLLGSIHCHGDIGAYSSSTDCYDERYRDGVHAIVGHVHREPPSFHVELAVDGHRFELEFDQFFAGYRKRRQLIPQDWLDKVKVKVDRPRWYTPPRSYTDFGYGYERSKDSKPWYE
jgi:hypothetical protein